MISELLQHKNYLSSYYDREKMLISSTAIYDYDPKQRQAVVWYNVERFSLHKSPYQALGTSS